MTHYAHHSGSAPASVSRILLIDDHPAMVFALTTILERDPLLKVVGAAETGKLALKRYRELKPDLLLVDLDLPELDGLNLIETIRRADNDVKILVVSSQKATQFATRCQAAGANGYVEKCEDIPQIQNAVRATLSGYNCFPAIKSTATAEGPISLLSEREVCIMKYLARGWSNKQIGDALSISNKTVSTHKNSILTKLGITNIVDLAHFAKANDLL
ncbi:LuxR family transcriptional regulator [Burkholderia ubonensis]|uniref:response regulator transcription factor n=1 Tax=Burkholderia ubonensis TaxID=101571 RepID=UPI0007572A79|nr:response regulator transcription factor [Burkholderia ubonensis]KVP86538.1 LuxR family transcriptional regulator [Burkholderia ubonensis]